MFSAEFSDVSLKNLQFHCAVFPFLYSAWNAFIIAGLIPSHSLFRHSPSGPVPPTLCTTLSRQVSHLLSDSHGHSAVSDIVTACVAFWEISFDLFQTHQHIVLLQRIKSFHLLFTSRSSAWLFFFYSMALKVVIFLIDISSYSFPPLI